VGLVMLCILRSRSKSTRAEVIVETDMRISFLLKSTAPIKMCSQVLKRVDSAYASFQGKHRMDNLDAPEQEHGQSQQRLICREAPFLSTKCEVLGFAGLSTIILYKHPLLAARFSLHVAHLNLSISRSARLTPLHNLTAVGKFEMDAGSIFLICFVGAFGSLLVGGWWFGHPLLVHCAKRKPSQIPSTQNRQEAGETAQGVQDSNESAEKAGSLNWSSWRHLIYRPTATSTPDHPIHSSRASPVNRLSSITPQSIPSCYRYKVTEFVVIKEPHDLNNMAAVPPVPKQSLTRPVAEIGTQVSLLLFLIWHARVPPFPPAYSKAQQAHTTRHLQQHFSPSVVKTL
jgi:hypothetical protein